VEKNAYEPSFLHVVLLRARPPARLLFCCLLIPCFWPALALVHPDVAGLLCSLGNSPVAPVAKFAVAFPLLYHWLGGVRHTVWDKVNKARRLPVN